MVKTAAVVVRKEEIKTVYIDASSASRVADPKGCGPDPLRRAFAAIKGLMGARVTALPGGS